MILMLAPGPNIAFGAMPSGAAYVADQFGFVKIRNNSAADQSALQAAGCYLLSPFGGWGHFGFAGLSDLYAADTGSLLPGLTGYPQNAIASVFEDGANNGTWVKTSAGNGAGAWTKLSSLTIDALGAALTAAETSLGAQIVDVASDSNARDLAIQKALAAAPRKNPAYFAFDTLDRNNLRQLVSIREVDARTFYLTSDNDNVLGDLTDDNLVLFSRPNGEGNWDTLFVPAEGGTAYPLFSTEDVICLGDSLTEGGPGANKDTQSYPHYLAVARGAQLQDGIGGPIIGAAQTFTVTNDGLGGQTSDQMAARFNALPVYISPGTIPTSGSVTIGSASISLDLLWNAQSVYITTSRPAIIAGIEGILTRLPGTPFGSGDYTFTRSAPGPAVTGLAGVPLTMDLAAYTNRRMELWCGRNDSNADGYANTRTNIANILNRLTPLSKRVIVVGLTTLSDGSEDSGTAAYTKITQHNADLDALYGLRFIDIRRYLIDHGLADAGITPTADDTTAIGHDVIPPSLMYSDKEHFLPITHQLIATQIEGRMQQMGWGNP